MERASILFPFLWKRVRKLCRRSENNRRNKVEDITGYQASKKTVVYRWYANTFRGDSPAFCHTHFSK